MPLSGEAVAALWENSEVLTPRFSARPPPAGASHQKMFLLTYAQTASQVS